VAVGVGVGEGANVSACVGQPRFCGRLPGVCALHEGVWLWVWVWVRVRMFLHMSGSRVFVGDSQESVHFMKVCGCGCG